MEKTQQQKPTFPTGPGGETDELCDRGDNGEQCHRHPSHVGPHVYDADHELAKIGKLTKTPAKHA